MICISEVKVYRPTVSYSHGSSDDSRWNGGLRENPHGIYYKIAKAQHPETEVSRVRKIH